MKAQSRESRKEFQNFDQSKSSLHIPNALLLTHAHDDHIKDLPILLNNVDEECRIQLCRRVQDIINDRPIWTVYC